jgi:outer membrane protein TolC
MALPLTSTATVLPEARTLTLDEAILTARLHSVDAAVALNELRAAYWEYRSFRADLLPELSFKGTLPTYSKQYSAYQTDNGRYTFVRSNYLEANGQLSATQTIWPTGGTLSLNTSLDYLRQYGSGGEHRYMTVPFGLTLNQTVFGVNDTKWKRRIEPIRYREAKANFLAATESVTMKAITYYFNLLLAKENLATAQLNYANAQRLCEVAKAKRQMGQISENDLLQLRLTMLNAESALTTAQTALNSNRFKLVSFLDLPDSMAVDPVVPNDLLPAEVSYRQVLEKASLNNAISLNIHRRQLQADYDVATARGNLHKFTVYASVGYTGQAQRFHDAYTPLKDYQTVEVGVSIPILDWGKRRGKVRVAESNRETTQNQLRQEQMTFNQDLFILVEDFNNEARQLRIATEADSIAQRRYRTNIATFLVGNISTLELNDAQTSKDEARQRRISELYSYWYDFYKLRSLTLWDFHRQTDIDADFEALVKN